MIAKQIKSTIEYVLGETIEDIQRTSGKITTNSGKHYFLKCGSSSRSYRCEANGLKELSKANAIRIAQVIAVDDTYILTEYIQQAHKTAGLHRNFGMQLARMHRHQSNEYGFYEDNFIGVNPQLNVPADNEKHNWPAFYFNKRLLYQYKLAEKKGYATTTLKSGFLKLEYNIENILENSTEPPALLHGDLWSGNYIYDSNGNPVLIDPAVYYGHREADLAMTKVFAGFSKEFYESYMQAYPLPEGWEYRENLYKLYHILNHLNIFGRSYLSEAEYLIRHYI